MAIDSHLKDSRRDDLRAPLEVGAGSTPIGTPSILRTLGSLRNPAAARALVNLTLCRRSESLAPLGDKSLIC